MKYDPNDYDDWNEYTDDEYDYADDYDDHYEDYAEYWEEERCNYWDDF